MALSRKKKILLWSFLGLLAALIVAYLFVLTPVAERIVKSEIAKLIKVDVVSGDLCGNLVTNAGFRNLELRPLEGSFFEGPAKIELAMAEFSLWEAVFGGPVVRSVEVRGIDLPVDFKKLEAFIDSLKKKRSPSAVAPAAKKPSRPIPDLPIITVSDFDLKLRIKKVTITAKDISVSVDPAKDALTIKLNTGGVSIDTPGVKEEFLEMAHTASQVDYKTLAVRSLLKFKDFPLEIEGTLDLGRAAETGMLDYDMFFKYMEGKVHAVGEIDTHGKGTLSGKLDIDNAFLPANYSAGLALGRIFGKADFRLPDFDEDLFTATGDVHVKGPFIAEGVELMRFSAEKFSFSAPAASAEGRFVFELRNGNAEFDGKIGIREKFAKGAFKGNIPDLSVLTGALGFDALEGAAEFKGIIDGSFAKGGSFIAECELQASLVSLASSSATGGPGNFTGKLKGNFSSDGDAAKGDASLIAQGAFEQFAAGGMVTRSFSWDVSADASPVISFKDKELYAVDIKGALKTVFAEVKGYGIAADQCALGCLFYADGLSIIPDVSVNRFRNTLEGSFGTVAFKDVRCDSMKIEAEAVVPSAGVGAVNALRDSMASIELVSRDCFLFDSMIGEFRASFGYGGGVMELVESSLVDPPQGVRISASGVLDFNDNSLRFATKVAVDDLSLHADLSEFIGLGMSEGRVALDANGRFKLDDVFGTAVVDAYFSGSELVYEGLSIGKADLDLSFNPSKAGFNGTFSEFYVEVDLAKGDGMKYALSLSAYGGGTRALVPVLERFAGFDGAYIDSPFEFNFTSDFAYDGRRVSDLSARTSLSCADGTLVLGDLRVPYESIAAVAGLVGEKMDASLYVDAGGANFDARATAKLQDYPRKIDLVNAIYDLKIDANGVNDGFVKLFAAVPEGMSFGLDAVLELSGQLQNPQAVVRTDVRTFMFNGPKGTESMEPFTASLRYREGFVEVEPFIAKGSLARLEIGGRAPVPEGMFGGFLKSAKDGGDFRFTAKADQFSVEDLRGMVEPLKELKEMNFMPVAEAVISGNSAKMSVKASVTFVDGRFVIVDKIVPMEDVDLSVEAEATGSLADFSALKPVFDIKVGCKLLMGLELVYISGSGKLASSVLDGFAPEKLSYSFNIMSDRALIISDYMMRVRAGVNLSVEGGPSSTLAKGTVRVDTFSFEVPIGEGASSPEGSSKKKNKKPIPVVMHFIPPLAGLDWLKYDIGIVANDNLELTHENFEGVAGCNLKIVGTGAVPEITGDATIKQGTIKLYTTDFAVEHCGISFPGGTELPPTINLTAKGRLGQVQITLRVNNSIFDPSVNLSSEPFYSQDDIMMILASGGVMRGSSEAGKVVSSGKFTNWVSSKVMQVIPGGKSLADEIQSINFEYEFKGGTAEPVIRAEYPISTRFSMFGEKDEYGYINFDIQYVFRLKF